MSTFGGFGVPGQGAALMSADNREIFAQGFEATRSFYKSCLIDSSARDAVNSPTTLLRAGLLLGQITASGKFIQWDTAATDGTQNIAGVLKNETSVIDLSGTARSTVPPAIIQGLGLMNASQLLIKGSALVGHADEYLARRQLAQLGFWLDDDMSRSKAGLLPRFLNATGTTLTVTAAQNGTKFFLSNAAAVAVTLPTLVVGLEYWFYRTADEEIVVASAAGDDIVVGNDLSADSVTITTAGQQIGQAIHIYSTYIGAGVTPKWIIDFPVQPFGTGLTGGFAYSIAT